jgi:hypothetical protein
MNRSHAVCFGWMNVGCKLMAHEYPQNECIVKERRNLAFAYAQNRRLLLEMDTLPYAAFLELPADRILPLHVMAAACLAMPRHSAEYP